MSSARTPGAARPAAAALGGGRVRFRRQVIDLPEAPVRVIEHVVVQRRCTACGRQTTPPLDLSAQVLGQHRVSLRLMGLIALLREQLRLPLGRIQEYLQTGRSTDFEEAAASVPSGLLPLLDIPGLGPKTISMLWKQRGITNLEARIKGTDEGDPTGLK